VTVLLVSDFVKGKLWGKLEVFGRPRFIEIEAWLWSGCCFTCW